MHEELNLYKSALQNSELKEMLQKLPGLLMKSTNTLGRDKGGKSSRG